MQHRLTHAGKRRVHKASTKHFTLFFLAVDLLQQSIGIDHGTIGAEKKVILEVSEGSCHFIISMEMGKPSPSMGKEFARRVLSKDGRSHINPKEELATVPVQ